MSDMKNIKLIVEYDGSNYFGWQKQKNPRTVQETIENSIYEVTGEKVKLIGASRTDSGVHARAYVCNFFTESNIPSNKLYIVINQKLPEDIVVLSSEEVSKDFHSRFASHGKMYSYTILNRNERPAINRNYVYQYGRKLDIKLMQEAAKYFLGKHDFTAFKSTGSSVKDSIRTITDIQVIKEADYIKFYVSGDGFLYNMVRIIVGTLLDVGECKIEPKYVKEIIVLKDRNKAGRVVPARGLCLEKVFYY